MNRVCVLYKNATGIHTSSMRWRPCQGLEWHQQLPADWRGRMREFLQGTWWLNFVFLASRTRGDGNVLLFHGICSSVSKKRTLSQLVNDISPGRSQHRSTQPHHSLDTPSSWHSPFCIDVILWELFPCPHTVWEVESRARLSLWYAQHLLVCLNKMNSMYPPVQVSLHNTDRVEYHNGDLNGYSQFVKDLRSNRPLCVLI